MKETTKNTQTCENDRPGLICRVVRTVDSELKALGSSPVLIMKCSRLFIPCCTLPQLLCWVPDMVGAGLALGKQCLVQKSVVQMLHTVFIFLALFFSRDKFKDVNKV